MSDIISFCCNISPLWDSVKIIRDKVESYLKDYDLELIEASKMTASELIENAVKHGSAPDGEPGIRLDFYANTSLIKIKVTNKINTQDDNEILMGNISQIKASDNPEELYINRLTMLMEDTKITKSRLGLFRIAYEGEFDLDYKAENNTVTITAVRNIIYRFPDK